MAATAGAGAAIGYFGPAILARGAALLPRAAPKFEPMEIPKGAPRQFEPGPRVGPTTAHTGTPNQNPRPFAPGNETKGGAVVEFFKAVGEAIINFNFF